MLQHSQLNHVFHALSDPTRRAIVERLIDGPQAVSELAAPFAMSLSAIGQHIQLLESCGLVLSSKVGRVRHVTIVPDVMRAAENWFESHRKRWEQRFDRLGAVLSEPDEEPPPEKQPRRKLSR